MRDLLRNTFKHEGGGRGWRPIWLIWTKLQLYLWQVVFAGGGGLCETLKGKRLWNEAAYLILSPLECFGKSFSIIHFPRVMAVFCLHTCVGYITTTASKMPHSDLGWGNLPAVGQWMGSTRMYVSNPWDPIAGWFPLLGIPLPDCEIHLRVNQSLESRGIPLLQLGSRISKPAGSSSSHLYSSRLQWYCTKYCQTPLVLYVVRVSWS